MIYLVAIVHDKENSATEPFVATPLGPYNADETAALERGTAFLHSAYATDDVRTVEPLWAKGGDFDHIRGEVQNIVSEEYAEKIRAAKAQRCREVLARDTAEYWTDITPWEITDGDLDLVLEALGIDPADV